MQDLSYWMVYKLFPGSREELQGGFLDGFDLLVVQCSVYVPHGFSVINHYHSMFGDNWELGVTEADLDENWGKFLLQASWSFPYNSGTLEIIRNI